MQENKTLVQEALIQMKNVEEAIAENAKGILASTMKEEINQLVKESLSEQNDEDEVEADVDIDMDDMADDADVDVDMDTDNEDDMDMDIDTDIDMDMDSDESPIDLTDASDEEILKVFKAMGEEDGIIVKKDGDDIHLSDNNADEEYIVKLGESEEDKNLEEDMNFDELEIDDHKSSKHQDIDDIVSQIFAKKGEEMDDDDSVVYEIEFNEDEMEESDMYDEEIEESDMYDEEIEESLDEAYSKKSKKTIKPKGIGIGSGPKFTYKDKVAGGFKEDKKEGPKKMGTGKAKFEYKKGANMEGKSKIVKKTETKEAARTVGMGTDFRKGGLPKQRAHSKFNTAIEESLQAEVGMLREKNEEYRKALNVFREKLNEVAIFNSNLAYATRLFTEHSTTKKEKINILRRFDGVETLKESKNLYKSIKDELAKVETKPMNESVETKLNKQVSTGSSTTLIESKTYENPQFLRMKDLMGKLG